MIKAKRKGQNGNMYQKGEKKKKKKLLNYISPNWLRESSKLKSNYVLNQTKQEERRKKKNLY